MPRKDLTLEERIAALEKELKGTLPMKRLPFTSIQQKLQDEMQPDADTFILPKSVGTPSLEDSAVTTAIIADDSITSAKIASPNPMEQWETIFTGSTTGNGGFFIAGNHILGHNSANLGGLATGAHTNYWWYRDSDHAIAGWDYEMRVNIYGICNATAAGGTLTGGLSRITAVAGGAGVITITAAGALEITAPAFTVVANSGHFQTSTTPAKPSVNNTGYALSFIKSAAGAGNSFSNWHMLLQRRYFPV